MVPEAELENGVPQSGGWFVVNAHESRWLHNELGAYCGFEGKDEAAFDEFGVNLNVLPRTGQRPSCPNETRQRRSLFASMARGVLPLKPVRAAILRRIERIVRENGPTLTSPEASDRRGK